MTLSDYLALRRITQKEFAKELGVSAVSVTRYLRGNRLPHPWVMQRISEVTQGAVTPEDLIRFHPRTAEPPHQVRDLQDTSNPVTVKGSR